MKKIMMLLSLCVGLGVSQAWAQKSKKKARGADSQSGWIIKRTKDGIVKIPRKQEFRFEGSSVTGEGQRPSQSVLNNRPERNNNSLIPVRTQFRREALSVSGFSER